MSKSISYEQTHVDIARVYAPNPEGVLVGYACMPEQSVGTLNELEWVELENEPDTNPGLILTFYQTQLVVISGLKLTFALETRKPAPRSFLRTSSRQAPILRFDAVNRITDASQIHDSARYELGICRMGTLEMLGIGSIRKYSLGRWL